MSIACVFSRGYASYATSATSYAIEASLSYQPFIDDQTFQVLTGANQEGPYWTIPFGTLMDALTRPDVTVEESNGPAITATEASVVMMLPSNGEFVAITFDTAQVCDFVDEVVSTPFAVWENGHSFNGVIDRGEMPCIA